MIKDRLTDEEILKIVKWKTEAITWYITRELEASDKDNERIDAFVDTKYKTILIELLTGVKNYVSDANVGSVMINAGIKEVKRIALNEYRKLLAKETHDNVECGMRDIASVIMRWQNLEGEHIKEELMEKLKREYWELLLELETNHKKFTSDDRINYILRSEGHAIIIRAFNKMHLEPSTPSTPRF